MRSGWPGVNRLLLPSASMWRGEDLPRETCDAYLPVRYIENRSVLLSPFKHLLRFLHSVQPHPRSSSGVCPTLPSRAVGVPSKDAPFPGFCGSAMGCEPSQLPWLRLGTSSVGFATPGLVSQLPQNTLCSSFLPSAAPGQCWVRGAVGATAGVQVSRRRRLKIGASGPGVCRGMRSAWWQGPEEHSC